MASTAGPAHAEGHKDEFFLHVMHFFSATFIATMVFARALFHWRPPGLAIPTHSSADADETKVPLPRAAREDLVRPKVAWPTLGLLAAAYLITWISFWGYLSATWGPATSMVLSVLAKYLSFTALHDAVHSAVVPASARLNELCGYLAGFLLMAPFKHFKQIHLSHHRYAGDHYGEIRGGTDPNAPSLDPDEWAGRGPEWLLPLRWMTIPWRYVFYYFRNTENVGVALVEYVILGAVNAAFTKVVWKLSPLDRLNTMLVCHTVPTFLAFAFLAYFFDYIPHRPHVVNFRIDPYRTSHVTSLFGKVDYPLWSALALNQNMHAIHHAWPFVPWYCYNRLWEVHGQEFTARGTRTVPLLLTGPREQYFDELRQPKRD